MQSMPSLHLEQVILRREPDNIWQWRLKVEVGRDVIQRPVTIRNSITK